MTVVATQMKAKNQHATCSLTAACGIATPKRKATVTVLRRRTSSKVDATPGRQALSLVNRNRYGLCLDAASSHGGATRFLGKQRDEENGFKLHASQSSTTETSPVSEISGKMKDLVLSWVNIFKSAISNLSVKQVVFTIAAKLGLWKIPLLPFLSSGKHLKGLVNSFATLGIIGKKTAWTFEGLYNNYRNAVVNQNPGVDEAKVVQIMKQILTRVFKEFVDPYEFPSYHSRMLEPYNYYDFGQIYCYCMIDFKNSYIGHLDRFEEMEAQLKNGENVILLANHQSEADPGVWANMLEKRMPDLAENIIYVAGDRVVTDPLAKPFSMGRNLLCVHSKKYIDADPKNKSKKMKQNRATLSRMQKMLNEGGNLIWIAPSGGRDRPDDQGNWKPSTFDETTVALMYRLGSSAKSKTNFYPFAMWSWKIMPPPTKVVVELGEERIINHSGVGISLAEQLDIEKITKDIDSGDKAAVAKAITDATWEEMNKEYVKLDKAITSNAGSAMQSEGLILV